MTAHRSYVRAKGRVPKLVRVFERAKECRRVIGRQNLIAMELVRHRLDDAWIIVSVVNDLRNCAVVQQSLDMLP